MVKIWYDDETTYEGDWNDAPAYGVLFVQEPKMVHMGADYYLKHDGSIMNFRLKDLHQHLVLGIEPGAIKFGRWTSNEIWKKVHAKVFPGETVGQGQFGSYRE